MRIAMDVTAIGSQLGGDETLVTGMLRGLAGAVGDADRVHALASHRAVLPVDVLHSPRVHVERTVRRSGSAHFGVVLPTWLYRLAARGCAPDVVVSNTHAPVRSPAPVALMVTDLSFRHVPDAYPARTRARLDLIVRRQVRTAAVVLTISDFCRTDIVRTYGLPEEKVVVVPLAVDAPRSPDPSVRETLRQRGVRGPFLLYLGNLHPRKNVPAAIRAFTRVRAAHPELAGHRMVVAGRPWFGSRAEHDAAAAAPRDAVVFLDRVSDDEREVLLRDASALVYLSRFEGFGLPPLEAMVRGTPVLAADRTAIPEVCTGAAVLVDPDDRSAVDEGLRAVLTDGALRDRLIAAGYVNAARYTTASTGTTLLTALRRVSADRAVVA